MNSLFKNGYIVLLLLGLLLFACSPKYFSAKLKETKRYPIHQQLEADSAIQAFYKPYKQSIDSQMNAVIGVATKELKRAQPEGALNNLFTDAMADVARKHNIPFDFVHVNYKSLRVPITQGAIRTSRIFELMPFENLLVTVKMTGGQVQELFNYMARQNGDPIAGASFRIAGSDAEEILINGKPLNPASVYTILTSDYVANGGDGAAVYVKATGRIEYPVKVRDAILDYIKAETKAGREINPQVNGRVKSDKKSSNE